MNPPSDDLDPLLNPETQLVSFVLRFIYQPPAQASGRPAGEWHGVVRHVQSNREVHFTRWEAAVAFIAEHIPLDMA